MRGVTDVTARQQAPLPVLDELQFHVGNHAEDSDDHSAQASGPRHCRFEDTQGRALFIKFMSEIENVAWGTPNLSH
jgi:hypothetical protein